MKKGPCPAPSVLLAAHVGTSSQLGGGGIGGLVSGGAGSMASVTVVVAPGAALVLPASAAPTAPSPLAPPGSATPLPSCPSPEPSSEPQPSTDTSGLALATQASWLSTSRRPIFARSSARPGAADLPSLVSLDVGSFDIELLSVHFTPEAASTVSGARAR